VEGTFSALSIVPDDEGISGISFELAGPNNATYSKTLPVVRGPVDSAKPEISGRLYADWLLALPPGPYHITGTPVGDDGKPVPGCTPAEGDATVVAGMTAEVTLTASCSSPQKGGLDTTVVINHAPSITDIQTPTGKFVCLGTSFVGSLTAEDKDGDTLTWSFKVVGTPDGLTGPTPYCLANVGGEVSFASAAPGQYQVQATVTDGLATSTLTFPVYVNNCGEATCPGLAAVSALGQLPLGTDGMCVCEVPKLSTNDSIQPSVSKVAGVTDGEDSRPVARMANPAAQTVDFISNELLVMTTDDTALANFVARWNGQVVGTIDPAAMGGSGPKFHRVRIDLSLAKPDLAPTMWAQKNGVTGGFVFSSDDGMRLLAAALAETANDPAISVSINPLLAPTNFASRSTNEDPVGPGGYTRNAYDWTYMNRASAQDIGTAEAWTFLQSIGALGNRVRMVIADGGFIINNDMPASTFAAGPTHVPNPASCTGGSSCPWHGVEVALSAAAVPDNNIGVAGPAGPVADLTLLPSPAPDLFAYLQYIFASIPTTIASGGRILNISASIDMPAEMCLGVLVGVPICEVLNGLTGAFHDAGVLIFAAAGNDGKDVDKTKQFGPCPFCVTEEETIVVPCELRGVDCVGGLSDNSNSRAPASAFGSSTATTGTVDIYAPFTVFTIADPVAADSASMSPDTHVSVTNGTSFSSPYTAGVAALIWAANPSLSAAQVENILYSTAHTNSGDPSVHRWVNALGAVMVAAGFDTPPFLRILDTDFSVPQGTVIGLTAVVEELQHQGVTITWKRAGAIIGTGTHLSADTTSWPLGPNVVTAQAVDSVGNLSAIASVTVTITPPVGQMMVTLPAFDTGLLCPVGPTRGDSEFNGGPDIELDVALSTSPDHRSVVATIHFVATEANGGDSQVVATFVRTLTTVPPGTTILHIDSPTSFTQSFRGPGAGFQVEFPNCVEGPEVVSTFSSGMISQTRIVGDTPGGDISGDPNNCSCSTKINGIVFNPVRFTSAM
jgi:hypothetical protein